MWLVDCETDCVNGGNIRFGGIDTDSCGEIVGDTPILDGLPYWAFKLSGVVANAAEYDSSQYSFALVDSGSSAISGPAEFIEPILKAIGAKQYGSESYMIACDARFLWVD